MQFWYPESLYFILVVTWLSIGSLLWTVIKPACFIFPTPLPLNHLILENNVLAFTFVQSNMLIYHLIYHILTGTDEKQSGHLSLSLPVLFCSLSVSIYHFSIFRCISFTLCSVTLNSHICFNLSFIARYMQGSVEIILLDFLIHFLPDWNLPMKSSVKKKPTFMRMIFS